MLLQTLDAVHSELSLLPKTRDAVLTFLQRASQLVGVVLLGAQLLLKLSREISIAISCEVLDSYLILLPFEFLSNRPGFLQLRFEIGFPVLVLLKA